MVSRLVRPGLAATAIVAVAVAIGGCDGEDEPPVGVIGTAGATPVPTETEAGRLGLPPVATAVPQPEPVEAAFGRVATVTSVSLFGDKSTTIEVTLSDPIVATENELASGTVVTPNNGDVFLGLEVTIEGVDGVYDFNPRHFHLVPIDELDDWTDEAFAFDAPFAASSGAWDSGLFAPGLSIATVAEGARVSGYIYFDVPSEALDDAAIVLEAFLMVDGPAAAYWLLG